MNNPKFPEEIQSRITNEFLTTFKNCLEIIFNEHLNNLHKKPTYWNFYQWYDNSEGFNKALYTACELHNLMDLYTYRKSMELTDNEDLGVLFTAMLYEHGIIEEGCVEEAMPCPFKIMTLI